MTYNVCRPFVLYNDFLPPDTEPHREWQYLVFGYFDGIMVGGNIFDEGICSLERLWDYDMEQIKALEGRYSFQIIYGFRSDDETHYDEVFWKEALTEETEYPFIFITLFQGNISEYMYIREKCNFEKQLTDVGKRKVITYLTLDNSSMVMVLLCCEYRDGAAVIDDFHRGEGKILLEKMGIKLSYSFTLAAIQKMYLNSPAIDSMQGSDSLIENVYIYAIEKYPGSIEEIRGRIEKQLGKQVKKESILGCNDEVIVVDNISWFEFLKWFQSSTGILNHSSWEYEQYLLGVTTIIARSQMSVKSSEKDGDEDVRRFYRDFSEVLRTRIREIEEKQMLWYRNLEHYLYQVMNALQKFEKTPLPDYVGYPIFMPIATVLQMEKEVKENKKRLFFEYFYEFMKGLNLCVQNSIRSDRQFMQTLDFDIRIYNTPVRLNAYYNAFIYQMKRFLNMAGPASQPQEHEYEFLTCLGVTDNVKVRELFRNMSDGKRLFLVSIPENQTYDMRLMMVMLGHEVGHFVGQALRNREYRYSCAIQLMAKITAAYIRHKLEKNKMYGQLVHCDYIEVDEYWRRFDSKLETYLKVHMDKLGNLEYLKKYRYRKDSEIEETLLKEICEVYTKYQNYTFLLKETLPDAVSDVLGRHRRKLFDYLLEKEYLFCLENGSSQDDAARQRQTLSEIIGDTVKEITGYSVWEKRKFSIVSATEMMLSLFKECEADLVAILTLKLSLRDYLYAIWKSMEDQGYQEGKMPVEVVIRSGLITCCMFQLDDTKSGEYYWGQDELKKIQEEESAKVQKMVINIVNFKDCFFSVEGREQEEFNIKNTVDGFLNGAVLEIILRYLLKCRSTFEETFESREKGECSQRMEECVELQEKLISMYSLCQKKNVEKLIWDIQEHIEKHKKLLEAEIDRHIKNVKEDK